MYKAVELAKYIIEKCIDDRFPISNLQLQGILYNIQKAFIEKNNIAFADDIEAWRFGPIIPNAYYYFGGSGSMPIILLYRGDPPIGADIALINYIIESNRTVSVWKMLADTKNGAWQRVYNNGREKKVIPLWMIKKYG